MNVAEALAQDLVDLGVTHVFSVTGGGSIYLTDAIHKHGSPHLVYCHHEQAAAYAAEAYARASGRIGVCLVTLGPGASNAISGDLCAYMDSVPVLFISGQAFNRHRSAGKGLRQLGVQELDIVPIIKEHSKFSAVVQTGYSYRQILSDAVFTMKSGRPGPAWIEIPADVQTENVPDRSPTDAIINAQTLNTAYVPNKFEGIDFDDSEILEIAEKFRNAKRPLLLLGQGVRLSGAQVLTSDWLGSHSVPFMLAHNSLDLVPHKFKNYLGFPGLFGNRAANIATQMCDVLVSVGSRLSLGQTGYNSKDFARNAEVAMVDIDKSELDKDNLRLTWKVNLDAHIFLKRFFSILNTTTFAETEWSIFCNGLRRNFDPVSISDGASSEFVNSYRFVRALSQKLKPGDTVVTDMGIAYQSTYQTLSVNEDVRVITNTGFAPMGWGLPASIGAALVRPGKIYCLTGDGGLMMNLQELATLGHLSLPVVVLIFNNCGYLTIKQTQEISLDGRLTGVNASTGLKFPDFVAVAEAFGITALTLSPGLNSIEGILKVAESTKGPLVIDIKMDPNQIQGPKLVGRRDVHGLMVPARLEDMWPHLGEDYLQKLLTGQIP